MSWEKCEVISEQFAITYFIAQQHRELKIYWHENSLLIVPKYGKWCQHLADNEPRDHFELILIKPVAMAWSWFILQLSEINHKHSPLKSFQEGQTKPYLLSHVL